MAAVDKAKNKTQSVKGQVKEKVGEATGNDRSRRAGSADNEIVMGP